MHSNMVREDCRPAALRLPVPTRWSRGSCSLRCVLSGLFHETKLPQDAPACLTGGLHFPYRRLILRALGVLQRRPQEGMVACAIFSRITHSIPNGVNCIGGPMRCRSHHRFLTCSIT